MPKSQLPYLIQEALETGGWAFANEATSTESYIRGSEIVRIGTRPLRGTTPPSYVYEVSDPSISYRKTDMIVMNLLCSKLAKSGKLSDPDDNVSTTTE